MRAIIVYVDGVSVFLRRCRGAGLQFWFNLVCTVGSASAVAYSASDPKMPIGHGALGLIVIGEIFVVQN